MSSQPCILGEVLFDQFPNGRRVLGGAPFNVAWHLQAWGQSPIFISRVGADEDGKAVLDGMDQWGMDTVGVKTDENLPTGCVQVDIIDGEPHYDIVHPAAWDVIETPESIPDINLLYHGSLALRDEASRRACRRLRKAGPSLIFVDVNLRSPWWNKTQVLEDIEGADWVKLNRDELDQLATGTQQPGLRAKALLESFELQGILITNGSHGAELLTATGEHHTIRPDGNTSVIDTVGAGDAMTSVMLLGILRGWPLAASLKRAQDFASAVVGQRGATVQDMGFYRAFLDKWPKT